MRGHEGGPVMRTAHAAAARAYPPGMADEYLEMAESELEQAVGEWNDGGEVLTPDGRVQLAKVYALVSIARSLDRIANDNDRQGKTLRLERTRTGVGAPT